MKTPSRLLIALSIVACTKGPQPSIAQQTQTNASTAVSEGRRTAITAAVAGVAPAVVTVQTTMIEQVNPDAWSAMFGARPTTRVTPGLGTGFVVNVRLVGSDSGQVLASFNEAANTPQDLIPTIENTILQGRVSQ